VFLHSPQYAAEVGQTKDNGSNVQGGKTPASSPESGLRLKTDSSSKDDMSATAASAKGEGIGEGVGGQGGSSEGGGSDPKKRKVAISADKKESQPSSRPAEFVLWRDLLFHPHLFP
jgi:hypothetical protein